MPYTVTCPECGASSFMREPRPYVTVFHAGGCHFSHAIPLALAEVATWPKAPQGKDEVSLRTNPTLRAPMAEGPTRKPSSLIPSWLEKAFS